MKLVKRSKDQRFPKIDERFFIYDIVSDLHTEQLMKSFAQQRWSFPMTLYMESMESDKEAILSVPLPIKEIRSIHKNLYVTPSGWQREYIPAYVLQIEDENMLELAFQQLFYVAQQNYRFVLSNEPSLYYHGYHLTTKSETVEMISADYDGQGAVLLTMKGEQRCDNM